MAVQRSYQGIRTLSVAILLATVVIGAFGVDHQERVLKPTRLLQDEDAPVTGISFDSSIDGASTTSSVQEELVEALEEDDQVTVVGDVQFGELLCDSLVGAEDASALQFAISPDETIIATQTSYTVFSGDVFTDGIGRKVWAGDVADAVAEDGTTVTRTVSMTWGEVCDVETFLLKVTTQNADGSTSVIKSVPCDIGSSLDTCMVEIDLDFYPPGEAVSPTTGVNITDDSGSSRRLRATPGREVNHKPEEFLGQQRKLQSSPQIDVMFLYSEAGRVRLGSITPEQIETTVLEALVRTNQAMVNSEIDLVVSLVHVGPLPYDEDTTDTSTSLSNLRSSTDVGDLRDEYGADLVQLLGSYNDGFCGRGYYYNNNDASLGFSVTGGNCLYGFTHTHEFGHNLGCRHNREDTSWDLEYAHGYRYCDGEDPYRTIMSYSCGTQQVNYFSNPDVMYLNKVTGTATEDNARRIDDYKVQVSEYRTAPITPAPTPSPVSNGLVDAAVRTTVRVRANAYDERTSSDNGCDPDGCTADLTRDSVFEDESRWSCAYSLENKACRLIFTFGEPQDIVNLRMAFYKGDQRTRSFKVRTIASDGSRSTYPFTSSGETDGFETFELNTDETARFFIKPDDPNEDDWLSILEVEIMVL